MPSHIQYISCPNRINAPSPTSTPEELERRAIIQRNDLLLHEAVIKNDSDGVRKVLKEPVDVNSRNNVSFRTFYYKENASVKVSLGQF